MANKGAKMPLGATALNPRPGGFPLGSAHSRAAARSLMTARQTSDAENHWDKELDCSGLAECLNAARQRGERGVTLEHQEPIYIPPGRENTVRGQLAARINAARARMRQHEAR